MFRLAPSAIALRRGPSHVSGFAHAAYDHITGHRETLGKADKVMPGMAGRQLADRASETIRGLKVLWTTGYTLDAIVHGGILDPGTNFLQKPFSVERLALKVRSVPDS